MFFTMENKLDIDNSQLTIVNDILLYHLHEPLALNRCTVSMYINFQNPSEITSKNELHEADC